jgi:hypothetical protein
MRVMYIAGALALAACSDGEGRPTTSTSVTGFPTTTIGGEETTSDSMTGDGDGDTNSSGPLLDVAPDGDGDGDPEECAAVSEQAQNQFAPVDIIFAIDTSGSMTEEKNFVQQNMNMFSQQIFLANIDHHVVMIAEASPDGPCINVPLGSGNCPMDTKLPEYLHVFDTVGSSNALDRILATQPQWQSSIRPGSVKHLVVVSDDNSSMDAATFDAAFKALNPDYANYVFHAIVAFVAPDPLDCLLDPTCCISLIPISADVGDVYIQLANLTGGVAGDLCEQQFGPVFNQIAQSVQQNVPLACEWDIPDPPEGESFDPTKVNVDLTLDGMQESIYYVDSEAACNGGDGWFYLPDAVNPETIRICPSTCTHTQNATQAKVDILFGCATIPVG